jgi:cytochrome b6-f complex iron-sulfur subunit
VLIASFWTSVLALAAAAMASVTNMLWPRSAAAFGGRIGVRAAEVPSPGDAPRPNLDGHFLLVNLAPGEGRMAGDGSDAPGGLLALWWKCPHLGCTVPWRGTFRFAGDPEGRTGWFRCPCHQSTYTKAGVRVFGPAPRSMDTMALSVDEGGNLMIDTGDITRGDRDNPQRALRWPPA